LALFNAEFLYLYLLSINVEVKIYKTLVLHVVFYRCEVSSLALMEEHRLGVFENRVLRRKFGARRLGGRGSWRKLHNKELKNLHLSPGYSYDQIKEQMGRACNMRMRKKKCVQSFDYKTLRNISLLRLRCRWDNIKIVLKEIVWEGVDQIHWAQNNDQWWSVMNIAFNLQIP
jgi:hypothetical protein